MQKLYQILWSLVILIIVVATVIFSFGFILVAAAAVSLLGIYRYFIMKRRPREFRTKPYSHVEIIDVQGKVIDETIEARKPDKF